MANILLSDEDRLIFNLYYGFGLLTTIGILKNSKFTSILILIYSILFWHINWFKNDNSTPIRYELFEIVFLIIFFIIYLSFIIIIFKDKQLVISKIPLFIILYTISYNHQLEKFKGIPYFIEPDPLNLLSYLLSYVLIFCFVLLIIGSIYWNFILVYLSIFFIYIFNGIVLGVMIKYNSLNETVPDRFLFNLFIYTLYFSLCLYILMVIFKELKFAIINSLIIMYCLLIYSVVFLIDFMIRNKNIIVIKYI